MKLLRPSVKELSIGAVVAFIGLALSIIAYDGEWFADGDQQSSEQPGQLVFSPTGEFKDTNESAALIVHSFRATPGYFSVIYTIVSRDGFRVEGVDAEIIIPEGSVYPAKSNSVIGFSEGVSAGVLTTEPLTFGRGTAFTLRLDTILFAGSKAMAVNWQIPLVTTRNSTASIDFIERARLSPEDGVSHGDTTVGIAGPPGASQVEVLVVRGTAGASILGIISADGTATQVDATEFAESAGATGFSKPPGFPWPGAAAETQ